MSWGKILHLTVLLTSIRTNPLLRHYFYAQTSAQEPLLQTTYAQFLYKNSYPVLKIVVFSCARSRCSSQKTWQSFLVAILVRHRQRFSGNTNILECSICSRFSRVNFGLSKEPECSITGTFYRHNRENHRFIRCIILLS